MAKKWQFDSLKSFLLSQTNYRSFLFGLCLLSFFLKINPTLHISLCNALKLTPYIAEKLVPNLFANYVCKTAFLFQAYNIGWLALQPMREVWRVTGQPWLLAKRYQWGPTSWANNIWRQLLVKIGVKKAKTASKSAFSEPKTEVFQQKRAILTPQKPIETQNNFYFLFSIRTWST